MKYTFLLLAFLHISTFVSAQNTSILPDRVSVPKMTTVAKNALNNKTEGMMVYDATLQQFSFWTGSAWVNIGCSVVSKTGSIIQNIKILFV